MKIRNILPEFKIAGQPDPKDVADYKEKMKTLQQIQNNPRMRIYLSFLAPHVFA